MPVQIDRMDTTVEVTAPAADRAAAAPAADRAPAPHVSADALRDAIGRMMSEELDRFLRNRGMR